MKILSPINNIKNDIKSSEIRLRRAITEGCQVANRTADIYQQKKITKYFNMTKLISSKVVKGTTKQELPYIAGAIGMIIPLPFTSPILTGIGYITRVVLDFTERRPDKKADKQ